MHFDLPSQAEESAIYVEPIPDISDDFIRGMDASAVLANENSGVKYYNEAGEEQDVFKAASTTSASAYGTILMMKTETVTAAGTTT